MRCHRRLSASVFACACALLVAGAASAAMLTNESFETGPDPGSVPGVMHLSVGSTVISGWTVTRNPIEYSRGGWEAASSAKSVGLNRGGGSGPGGIAQTFATDPTAVYTATFMLAATSWGLPAPSTLRVTAAGQSQDYEFVAEHTWPWFMGWTEKTFTFTANAASTQLEFYSVTLDSVGPAIDTVRVVLTTPASVGAGAAARLALAPPSPSPSSGPVTFDYALPADGAARLSVIDVQGREVAVLADGLHAAGPHTRTWDGRAAGGRAPAGVYFIRLQGLGASVVRRAVLVE